MVDDTDMDVVGPFSMALSTSLSGETRRRERYVIFF
jgi:hypothetical protein